MQILRLRLGPPISGNQVGAPVICVFICPSGDILPMTHFRCLCGYQGRKLAIGENREG